MSRKLLVLLATLFICSNSFAIESNPRTFQFRTRSNIFGGKDIYNNGRYIGKTMPNTFGGRTYYGRNGKTITSMPNSITGGQDYFGGYSRDYRQFTYKRY